MLNILLLLLLGFASDDIHQQIRAMFGCPAKLRPKMKKIESVMAKRSVKEKEDSEDELDDFYLFW